jgi:hypothetical protein
MIDQTNVGIVLGGIFSIWFLFFMVEWFVIWVMKVGW